MKLENLAGYLFIFPEAGRWPESYSNFFDGFLRFSTTRYRTISLMSSSGSGWSMGNWMAPFDGFITHQGFLKDLDPAGIRIETRCGF